MKRYEWVLEVVPLAAIAVMAWLFVAHSLDSWRWSGEPRSGETRLSGRLHRLGFQFDGMVFDRPQWQKKWLWTDDSAFLARVESWLGTVRRRPAVESQNSLRRYGGGRIVLDFADGRREEILFLGVDGPGPSPYCCCGFSWRGRELLHEEAEPFTEFLRGLPDLRP